jgi:hypothetical protein
MELKRIQLAYRHYEGMGVPISGDLLSRSRKPNFDDDFAYLYDGTTKEDYNLALSVERLNCSDTFSEFFSSKHNKDKDKIEWMEQELAGEKEDKTECLTCEFTAGDADNLAFCGIHKFQNKCLWNKNWQERRRIKQNASHMTLQQMMRMMLLCKLHKNHNTCL